MRVAAAAERFGTSDAFIYRLFASRVLVDRRPRHRRTSGAGCEHTLTQADVLTLAAIVSLGYLCSSVVSSEHTALRRALAQSIETLPGAAYIVITRDGWAGVQTPEEAVAVVRTQGANAVHVVPVAALREQIGAAA